MTREEMLEKVKETVCGHREQDYGKPETNFEVIASYWDTYLNWKPGPFPITAEDVANMMCLFKLGRITSGTVKEDSYLDLAGYAACAVEIASEKKREEEFEDWFRQKVTEGHDGILPEDDKIIYHDVIDGVSLEYWDSGAVTIADTNKTEPETVSAYMERSITDCWDRIINTLRHPRSEDEKIATVRIYSALERFTTKLEEENFYIEDSDEEEGEECDEDSCPIF